MAAIVVVAFIFRTAWNILVNGVKVLLDTSLDYQTLQRIREIVISDQAVQEIKALMGKNSGSFKFIEAEITVRIHDLEKAHSVSERIKRRIREEIEKLDQVRIHYEPISKDKVVVAVPL